MASVLDKSLDQMISDRPKNARRPSRRGAARGGVAAAATPAGTARARYTGASPASNTVAAKQATAAATVQSQAGKPASDKIIVSNLPPDVNEAQIKELFSTTVGPLREVNLHFDQQGKSKGVAHVHFSRKGDGAKAYEQYNNRLIDGQRPMKIEIIVDPGRVPAPTLASRVAPAPVKAAVAAMEGVESTSGAGTRGKKPTRGRGRGRGGKRGEGRTPKTAADLDAEMEEYSAAPTAAPATNPAA